MSKKIVLGSGKLYVAEAQTSQNGYVIPSDATLEVESNLIGYIQGGATLEYSPEFYTAEDDLGLVSKTFLTKEEVIFKSGIMTWNGETLAKLCATARVTTASNVRTVKIGGIDNFNGKSYVIHFVHDDPIDGDIRITVVGSNESGFEMQFAKDKETVINAEFKAKPHDAQGTKVIFKEELMSPEFSEELVVGTNKTKSFTSATSATSSDTSVVTVSVASNVLTMTPVAAGTSTIIVKDASNNTVGTIYATVTAEEE